MGNVYILLEVEPAVLVNPQGSFRDTERFSGLMQGSFTPGSRGFNLGSVVVSAPESGLIPRPETPGRS